MTSFYIIIFLIIFIILLIFFKTNNTTTSNNDIKQYQKPSVPLKSIIKEPKHENSIRIKFSNDVKFEKSQKPSDELLSMYKEPKNEIPTDNPFEMKAQKGQLPYMNQNVELLKI
jgi:predicted RND superfamily exporter protein